MKSRRFVARLYFITYLLLVPCGGAELPARGARARDQHQAGGAAAAAARAARHPRQVPHLPAVITATATTASCSIIPIRLSYRY